MDIYTGPYYYIHLILVFFIQLPVSSPLSRALAAGYALNLVHALELQQQLQAGVDAALAWCKAVAGTAVFGAASALVDIEVRSKA